MNDFLSAGASRSLLGDRQCTAHNRDGSRCGRASALGQFVCNLHGAKAPLSIAAAKERLMLLVEPALDALLRALRAAPPCPACGRSDADRDPTVMRAAQLVLDRCGFHPTLAVVNAAPPADPYDGMPEEEAIDAMQAEIDHLQQTLDTLRRQRATRFLPAAEDGFIVPEDEDESAVPAADVQIPEGTPPESGDGIAETPEMPKETPDE